MDRLQLIIDDMLQTVAELGDDEAKSTMEAVKDHAAVDTLNGFIERLKSVAAPCQHTTQDVVEVRRISMTMMHDEVILWCRQCGAIQIAAEEDGRLISHYTQPIRLPEREKQNAG